MMFRKLLQSSQSLQTSVFTHAQRGGRPTVAQGRWGVRTGVTDTLFGMAKGAVAGAVDKSKGTLFRIIQLT